MDRTVILCRNVLRYGRVEFIEDVWESRSRRSHELILDDVEVVGIIHKLAIPSVPSLQNLRMLMSRRA